MLRNPMSIANADVFCAALVRLMKDCGDLDHVIIVSNELTDDFEVYAGGALAIDEHPPAEARVEFSIDMPNGFVTTLTVDFCTSILKPKDS